LARWRSRRVPGGATAIRAGLGGVWITYHVGAGAVWVMAQGAGALCRIDPAGTTWSAAR
jgi:hypothetical protein